mmetsp:Transcript_25860/g.57053  ORF Transcript_25860/g.57053 Transcript_25860/m.57053 type:complete len:166 (+) Transcript_25860:73-570(+)
MDFHTLTNVIQGAGRAALSHAQQEAMDRVQEAATEAAIRAQRHAVAGTGGDFELVTYSSTGCVHCSDWDRELQAAQAEWWKMEHPGHVVFDRKICWVGRDPGPNAGECNDAKVDEFPTISLFPHDSAGGREEAIPYSGPHTADDLLVWLKYHTSEDIAPDYDHFW